MTSKLNVNKVSTCTRVEGARILAGGADTPTSTPWQALPVVEHLLAVLTKIGGAGAILTGFDLEVRDAANNAVTVKKRLELECPTPLDGAQVEGDTGTDGNVYVLETTKQEIYFQASEGGIGEPVEMRVTIMSTAAAGDYALALVGTGAAYANMMTPEVVA